MTVLVALLGSCVPAEAAPVRSSNAWLRGLLGRPSVGTAEVLLAAHLMTEDSHWKPDPAWAMERGRSRGWLRRQQVLHPGSPATRGFAAQVFARALGIRGGVWMRLTGEGARHSYRELKFLGMLPEGGPGVLLTGDELAGLLAAASRWQEVGPERPATGAGR